MTTCRRFHSHLRGFTCDGLGVVERSLGLAWFNSGTLRRSRVHSGSRGFRVG